jgi:hypothetical protein
MDDEVLSINDTWPGTTIDGEPGIVSGTLTVSRSAGGGLVLDLVVGPAHGAAKDCDYVEFPLSPENARALRAALDEP